MKSRYVCSKCNFVTTQNYAHAVHHKIKAHPVPDKKITKELPKTSRKRTKETEELLRVEKELKRWHKDQKLSTAEEETNRMLDLIGF